MQRASLLVMSFTLALFLGGCPSEGSGGGSGNGNGGGGQGTGGQDAGSVADGGAGNDAGSAADAGAQGDGGAPPDAGVAAAVDPAASTVVADPTGDLEADGTSQSTVTITVVDSNGNPMPNMDVMLRGEPSAGLVFVQPFSTDSSGVSVGYVSSTIPDAFTIYADVGPAGSAVTLDASAQVEFSICLSKERLYMDMQGPVFSRCIGCHNEYGRAAEFGAYALKWPDDPDVATENVATLSTLTFDVTTDSGARIPYLIAKPLGDVEHFGGVVITEDDPITSQLYALVDRLQDETICPAEEVVDLFEPVSFLSPTATLRKATFSLTGRWPDAQELDTFNGTEAGLPAAIDTLLTEDAFYDRLIELYNDILLTDEALPGARALNRLNNDDFPDRFYFRPCAEVGGGQCCQAGSCCKDNPANTVAFCDAGKSWSNESVGREPLELIRHVVKENRPFTEILTADYAMLNPFSARVYGAAATFDANEANDRYEYVEGSIEPGALNGLSVKPPYSGIITSQIFLRRYPTTNTNVNRHRARNIYLKLLNIDIMTFLQLVIDQNEPLGENPFVDARTCSACHAAMDPVAGTFKNYRYGSRYVERNWISDMRLPGFKGEVLITDEESKGALAWLGGKLAQDQRFSMAVVKHMYQLVTGHKPLTVPTEELRDDFDAHYLAFEKQTEYLEEVRQRFVASNHDLKALIKDLILGPFFRAGGQSTAPSSMVEEALTLAGVGMGRVLTPEQLDRKIIDITGYPYKSSGSNNGTQLLLNNNRYRLLLGGIDSDVTIERFRDPYPIMGSIARRMANELSCLVIPQDFAVRDKNNRKFVRHVEISTVPEDADGNAMTLAQTNIREDLKAMHLTLLGETVNDGDPALEESYSLFLEVWRDGKARVDADTENQNMVYRCRALKDFYTGVDFDPQGSDGPGDHIQVTNDEFYTVRAWMAVTAFLLSDYHFLFE